MPRIYKDGVLYNTSPSTASQLPYDNNTSTKDKIDSKMDKANPTGTGSLSLNRKSGSSVGTGSVATGYNGTASGNYSFVGGVDNTASGLRAVAFGYNNTSSNSMAVATGEQTTASGAKSITTGQLSTASGTGAVASGYGCEASGLWSRAENVSTVASGSRSYASGEGTIANRRSQHVFGEYNIEDTGGSANPLESGRGNYVEIVGNGQNENSRSNARTLDWSGNEVLAGGLKINGSVDVGSAIAFSSGQITWNNTNVTGDTTRKVWQKLGRLVVANIEFTPIASKIAHGTVIATGFPLPLNSDYTVFDNGGQQVRVGTTGELYYYFPTDTTTIRRHELTIVYFTA